MRALIRNDDIFLVLCCYFKTTDPMQKVLNVHDIPNQIICIEFKNKVSLDSGGKCLGGNKQSKSDYEDDEIFNERCKIDATEDEDIYLRLHNDAPGNCEAYRQIYLDISRYCKQIILISAMWSCRKLLTDQGTYLKKKFTEHWIWYFLFQILITNMTCCMQVCRENIIIILFIPYCWICRHFKTKTFYFQSLQYQLRKLKHQVTENCHAVIFSMIVDVE